MHSSIWRVADQVPSADQRRCRSRTVCTDGLPGSRTVRAHRARAHRSWPGTALADHPAVIRPPPARPTIGGQRAARSSIFSYCASVNSCRRTMRKCCPARDEIHPARQEPSETTWPEGASAVGRRLARVRRGRLRPCSPLGVPSRSHERDLDEPRTHPGSGRIGPPVGAKPASPADPRLPLRRTGRDSTGAIAEGLLTSAQLTETDMRFGR